MTGAGTGASHSRRTEIHVSTLCRAYATEVDAHAAVDRLLLAGAPAAGVRVLMGAGEQDLSSAPVGSFAGDGGERLGAYAGAAHSTRQAMGGFAGDPNGQRRGGFADVDRETVTTYRDGVERVRIASHHDLRRMLVDAGLDEATAMADVEALHHGRVLVLVTSTSADAHLAALLDA
jgi:hypothetical protein